MCHLCHLWKITEAIYQREQVVKLFQVKEKQQEEDEMLEVWHTGAHEKVLL